MQSGVTQAALTTFLNNQQRGNANQSPLSQPPSAVQNVSANNLTQVSPVSSEIQPVIPTSLTGASTNNSNSGQSVLPGRNNIVTSEAILQAAEPAPLEGNSQGVNIGNNDLALSEVISSKTAFVQTGTNSASAGSVGALTAAPQSTIVKDNFGLNVREINSLDAVVARLNISALHPTQGSLSIGTNTVLPSSALTMGQIVGVLEANQLSSGSPVVPNGNPSVPLQQPLLNPNVNSEIISTITQSQLSQPETIVPSTTTGSQTVALLSTAIRN